MGICGRRYGAEMMNPLAAKRGLLSPLGRSVRRPEAGGWWLSGGIAAANCIAAYQPKGAADYAASKVNLTGNATYNAVDGAASPTWDDTNGWKFAAASSQYIDTGITPVIDKTWSVFIRFTNVNTNYGKIFGTRKTNTNIGMYIQPYSYFVDRLYFHGQTASLRITSGKVTSGIMGFAGLSAFYNGTKESSQIPDTTISAYSIPTLTIGVEHTYDASNVVGFTNFITAYVQAFAIYNTTITDTQVGLLTTAMAAL